MLLVFAVIVTSPQLNSSHWHDMLVHSHCISNHMNATLYGERPEDN